MVEPTPGAVTAAARPRARIGLRRLGGAVLLWLAVSAGAGVPDALAQFQRNLPANGALAVMRADGKLPLPLVRLDSRIYRLAPGGIIVDQNNRTLLHQELPPQAAVYVVFDGNGEILRMFLLTPQELQRLRAR